MSSAEQRREPSGAPASRTGAWTMVAIQAVLFLAVAVAALTPPLGPALWSNTWVGLALVAPGVAGLVLSARHLGRALTPLPIPNGEGLAAHGIYRVARHPMYTSLVLICAGVAASSGTVQSWAAVLALAVFFAVKARIEERYLRTVYPGYDEYAAVVGRFVPGLGTTRGRGGQAGGTQAGGDQADGERTSDDPEPSS